MSKMGVDACRRWESSRNVGIEAERWNQNVPFQSEVAASNYILDFEFQNPDPKHMRLLWNRHSRYNEMGRATRKII